MTRQKLGTRRVQLPLPHDLLRDQPSFPKGVHIFCPDVSRLRTVGNVDLLNRPSLAIVGSRHASAHGLELAEQIAVACAKSGIIIFSGYAKGVDTVAHKGALFAGGCTVFVLPFGIKHFQLKLELRPFVDEPRWLAISQFPDDQPWFVSGAMKRNQVLSALADGVLIVEAGETGGTVDEAHVASRMQKPLYVIRYSSPAPTAAGNEMLISKLSGVPIGSWKDVKNLIENHAIRDENVAKVSAQQTLF